MSIEIRGRAVYICMYRQKFPEVTWYSKRNECTKMNGVHMLKTATTGLATKSRILAS